jgi:hypothetical protein
MKSRPVAVTAFTVLAIIAGLLTGYFGLSAAGYLVPAATLLLVAALAWFGRWHRVVAGVLIANLVSGLLLVLMLAFGSGLGDTKLDISGVALLVNLLTGGPLLGLISGPLLLHMRNNGFGASRSVSA